MRRRDLLAQAGAWALGLGMASAALAQAPAPPTTRGPVAPGPGRTATAPAPTASPARAPAAPAQPRPQPQPKPVDPAAQKQMDELLAQWEARSGQITSLDARFTRRDESKQWNQTTDFEGRAILKSPNLAFLDFRKKTEKGVVPDEQIRCTGDAVYQYKSETRQIFIYPLAQEDRKRALEEGPLPFLFNMKAEDAKKRYEMALIEELPAKGEQPGHWVIRIIPLQEIDRESFTQAIVWLNKGTFMPDALRLYAANGKDTQTYRFNKVEPNAPVNMANFQGRKLDGWDVVENPGPDGKPRPAGSAPAAAASPAASPAPPPGRMAVRPPGAAAGDRPAPRPGAPATPR